MSKSMLGTRYSMLVVPLLLETADATETDARRFTTGAQTKTELHLNNLLITYYSLRFTHYYVHFRPFPHDTLDLYIGTVCLQDEPCDGEAPAAVVFAAGAVEG